MTTGSPAGRLWPQSQDIHEAGDVVDGDGGRGRHPVNPVRAAAEETLDASFILAALLVAARCRARGPTDPHRFSDNLTAARRPTASSFCSPSRSARRCHAKGGILGRPVGWLLRRPDQPGERAGHLHKVIDIDKVDLLVGPYGTNFVAPAIP